nr:hypothetical protein [Moritella yayanosii]
MAQKVVDLLRDGGIESRLDADRGWDHGVWIPIERRK